ncbi:MAG: glycosyltransferase family 9 protein [Cyanobacteria bacterium SIG28]|nr:glycosyltransferase family 9 protein [Cyanobacteria bacterium SIG28]
MTEKSKKILFINFGGLGDEILFLPTIQAIKNQFTNSHITLALETRAKGVQQITDTIDEVLIADIKGKNKYFELLKLLFKIWKSKYNIVISSGSNKFISIFLFLTLIKEKYGYNTGKLSQLLLTKTVELNKNQFAGLMYYELAKPLTNKEFELANLSIQKKPSIPNSILIHPGVSKLSVKNGMIKTISANQWAEIIEKLTEMNKEVFLIGGPDDKDVIEIIEKKVDKNKYKNLFGTTKNLKELAELISEMECFLCSDSAPLHIATALGVKTFAIFGSTDDKKLIPENSNTTAIKSNNNCPLQPCLWEKRQTTCKELHCLQIPTDKIIKTIEACYNK